MATTKVSELAALTTPDGAEELLINDGGTSKKITIANAIIAGTGITKSGATISASPVALTTVQTAANQTAHLALTAQEGDVVVRSDENKTYMHNGGSAGNMNDYTLLATPTDAVTSVGGNTGVVTNAQIAASVEAASDSNTFTDADHSKLNAIEASADVTDATNVTAAGALMDSEVTNLAEVKAFAASDYATAAQGTTANAALPKAGGAMTGAITTNSTFDGVDIATRDAVLTSTTTTANAALPKAGGTMTGDLILGDNVKLEVGSASGGDLQIYHDTSNSYISEQGTGDLKILATSFEVLNAGANKYYLAMTDGGALTAYHNGAAKLATTANGVTVTGGAVGTMTTDNDGSFSMSASNNFKCTPTGNFTLTFTNIVAQSGNILLVNSGGHTVAAHANTKVDANLLATVSTAGTYLLSYFSDGTNVYMTNSAIYT